MKRTMFLFIFLHQFVGEAQIITTVAGNGTLGHAGDSGPASAAILDYPFALKFDHSGNCYFSEGEGCRIRKISPTGIISTIAGTGTCGYNGDGIPATSAELNNVAGIAIDSIGNLFIADGYNNKIRKINVTTGVIATIAGTGIAGYRGDGGLADTAQLNNPFDVCFDRFGNLYIADEANSRVRKINTSGIISTLAGTGSTIFSGEGGPATAAGIWAATGLCTDTFGNVYLAARFVSRVLKVDTTGILTVVAGNGLGYSTGDWGAAISATINPERLEFDDSGNLYISCIYKYCVRKIDTGGIIHTVVGMDTVAGYVGDGLSADSAKLDDPVGIGFDHCGNLYIADEVNNRIRKVAFNPSCILDSVALNFKQVHPVSEINIYPNPTFDQLNINNLKSPATYQMLNIVSATIQQGTLNESNNSILMQSLPDGMYMLEITDEQKNRTVYKIIKQ